MRLKAPESQLGLSKALHLMTAALDILDELYAPGEIGSILDLAITRLDKFLDNDDDSATSAQMLMSKLEQEFAAAPASSKTKPSPWENSSGLTPFRTGTRSTGVNRANDI